MRTGFISLFLLLAIVSPVKALETSSAPVLKPTQQQAEAAQLTAEFLQRFHYKPVSLDDKLSARIMDRFIDDLDPDRLIFLQADVESFKTRSKEIDDGIKNQDLSIPFAIYNIYGERVDERMTFARQLLNEKFDFSSNETYSIARDKKPWPASAAERDELWRKRIKNDWLRLKLAGKDDAAIRDTLTKRYENTLARANKSKADDVFQLFMAAYTTSVDPHTDYFGANASAEFDISMKLSLVGIGAVLQERDEFTTIRELTAGGPAQLSGKLSVGDRIVGVGQGKDGAIKEVVGMRLDEVVQLIRGDKDSVVRLEILPADAGPDGQHRIISLVRDKISLDKQAAQKSVFTLQQGEKTRKIGIIKLPAFYEDIEARRKGDNNYRSASRDVARLLAELAQEKVDGVLLDLRNNGGGSLSEAIDLTGLFVGKGPVVQQRNAKGEIQVENDKLPSAAWTGPLGVLINRGSASASEIFAAAIQDYDRGVVIGEPSFGKGTVQTVVNLDEVAQSPTPKFGELKLTIAQFFRVNGGTTQLRGVTPDIRLPGLFNLKTVGEESFDNALPWTEIKATKYRNFGAAKALLPQLQQRHEERVKTNPEFQRFVEDVDALAKQRDKASISLNENERRAEIEAAAKRARAEGENGDGGSVDDGLQANERSLSDELAREKARKSAKDALQDEAASIVIDLADLQKTRPQSKK
ncbi:MULTISPECIES: carboxy terminal-processing peptidase [Ochrobactrum]|uniref:Tail-specific protease n=1 Tax=Ochrobactrum quorumnocens TaxID=271865 RepID=A0A5N1JSA7_9HYPH|nr:MULTISPECIES: carboxy terminal-processing peptidase [Brucella/Ochrobactrum group]KAA9367077.1 tail-specific protease [[Ochrobactrum] quorumnocens]MDH7793113.1 carboxyl-terminal processing protease [Ochrobactrum sp. AN78]